MRHSSTQSSARMSSFAEMNSSNFVECRCRLPFIALARSLPFGSASRCEVQAEAVHATLGCWGGAGGGVGL